MTIFVAVTVREIRRGVLYKVRAPDLLKTLTNHRSALSTYLTDYPASARDFQRQLPAIESTLLAIESKVGWWFSRKRRVIRKMRLLVSHSRSGELAFEPAEQLYNQLTFLVESLEQDWRDRQWL